MPIIKSTTRKDTQALTQLVTYVFAHDTQEQWSFTLLHNITARPDDQKAITQALVDNDKHRKKRKGGVILYHDVMSFAPLDAPQLQMYPHIMEDLAREYITRRAPYGVALAKVHQDKEHLHVHFVISTVEKGNSISLRISRNEFRKIRREIERLQVERYPELEYSYVHESIKNQRKFRDESFRRSR